MKFEIEIGGKLRTLELEPGDSPQQYHATMDGEPIEFEARFLRPGVLSLILDDRSYRVVLEEDANDPAVYIVGRRFPYRLDDPRSLKARRAHAGSADGPRPIKASMPGRVVRVLAQPGDVVEVHQGIVVIEAMKMQNEIKSPKAGTVSELRVAPGDTVAAGEVLAIIH
jgi:biotin carboxyl carrier protein